MYSTKTCIKCGETKPLTEFYRHKKSKDGLRGECKTCCAAYARAYYANNRDAARDANRRWRKRNPGYFTREGNKRNSATAQAHARVRQLKRETPAWADRKALIDFYAARPDGMQVDHIIPIKGDTVTGLNVPENLQYLTPEENRAKGNKVFDLQTVW